MAPFELPPISPSPPPDDSDRRRQERANQEEQKRFLRRLTERNQSVEQAEFAPPESPSNRSAAPPERRTDTRPSEHDLDSRAAADSAESSSQADPQNAADSSHAAQVPRTEIARAESQHLAVEDRGSSETAESERDVESKPVAPEHSTASPKRSAGSGERRADHVRSAEKSGASRGRESAPTDESSTVESRDEKKQPDDVIQGIAGAQSEGLGLAMGGNDAVKPNPDSPIPPHVVRQAVEFATFSERGGVMEFSLGLTANVLGGAVMTLRALGDRKVSIKVVNGKVGKSIQSGDLEELVRRMKARGIEVVEVAVS